ncbi:MAG: glycosyltransferase family 2 protein [Bacilli bacterium]
MILPLKVIIAILFGLLLFAFAIVFLIFTNKLKLRYDLWLSSKIKNYLIDKYINHKAIKKHYPKRRLTDEFINICEQMELEPVLKEQIIADFHTLNIVNFYMLQLNSWNITKRKLAAHYLGFFASKEAILALANRLKIEKNNAVKLYILNGIKNHLNDYLDVAINSLIGANQFYRHRAIGMIKHHHNQFGSVLQDAINRHEFEIKELIVAYSDIIKNDAIYAFLKNELQKIESFLFLNVPIPIEYASKKFDVKQYYLTILENLVQIYNENINQPHYLNHEDHDVRRIVVDSKSKQANFDGILNILNGCDGGEVDNYRIEVITRISETNRDYYMSLVNIFQNPGNIYKQKVIASVLSFRMDYLILKLNSAQRNQVIKALKLMVGFGLNADLIDFLNRNKDPNIEVELTNILTSLFPSDEKLRQELNQYLNSDILLKMGIIKEKYIPAPREKAKSEKNKKRWLITILIFTIILLPIIFVVRYFNVLLTTRIIDLLIYYAVDVNTYIVYYYAIVNIIYIVLVILSIVGSKQQVDLWHLKNKTMLFENEMLSQISIIAPAYNEELSIIDSVNSLLNLNYPQYEVIVVNDGSKDSTLLSLIKYFKLERKNIIASQKIPTKNVRGVYKNKLITNLTVIDKENGGKADALNVGINYAKSEFVCGIDADSLLEVDSLLKLMSVTIDHKYQTIALGGNIFPANGCVIDHGQVEKKGLPKTLITRLQAIEYLRAFTSGRIGWAKLHSLLIVSGAFGLFHRETLINAGGYLTSSGIYKKDTVGEDMELVVRLSRKALEMKLKYHVDYVYNATCYTEVPNDWKSLLKQRNRWHRGLIDILSFHRLMIFNPKYKQVGTIGFPYFFLFEMIGPLFEIQGYLMLFLCLIFGLLNVEILLSLFIVTVMMGIIISLLALYVTERESKYLGVRDTLLLVLFGFLENLGYRQFVSLFRVRGFFAALNETGAWGTVTRAGFKKTK